MKISFPEAVKTKSEKTSAGLLIGIVLLVTLGNAIAGQSMKPLAVTVTVLSSCVVSTAELNPRNSIDLITGAMNNGLNLVRGRCDKGTVWRVDVVSGTNKDITGRDRIAAANAHSYSFYMNSDQALFWNNVKRSNLVPEIGSGSDREPSAYGRNPAKALHAPADGLNGMVQIAINF